MSASDYDDDLYDDDDEDTMLNRYLTFAIGKEAYGIEIRQVIEIVGLQQITEVPDMPEYVMGVINLRGSVIPVVCVRRRFNMPPKDHDERTCVVVVQIADISVGLIVDEVDEVLEITADQVTPPPRVRADGASRFVAGLGRVGEAVKILLDVERLLRDGDIQQLAQIDE